MNAKDIPAAEALNDLVNRVNGFVYAGDRLDAVVKAVQVLRADPTLARALLLGPDQPVGLAEDIPAEVMQAAALAYDHAVNDLVRNPPGGTVLGEYGRRRLVEHPAFRAAIAAAAPYLVAEGRRQAENGGPLTVYVAMICDRHTDPEPYVFTTAEAAIDYARSCAVACAREPEDVEESAIDGWLYHATYSEEGDSVWVIAKTLDQP